MAYADGYDLVARYDIDVIGDLATDEREPLDRDVIPTHPHVLVALEDAAGEMDVALQAGGMYTPAQLAAMTGNSLNHRKRINCAIAMALLFERRPGVRMDNREEIVKNARGHITALRRGENVFGIPEHIDAAVMELATVSSVEIDQLNLLPNRMEPYFPGVSQRTPHNQ